MPWFRGLVAAGLALLVLLGAGAVLGARPPAPAGPDVPPIATTDRLDATIERAQHRLRRLPGDYRTWAELGLAYLERSRITADPSYYQQAEGALHRSLAEKPEGNPDALVGLGALANARHDFAAARELAQQAIALNLYHAGAHGVLADAETQLGHPEAATAAVQRMLDLNPGLPALARAAYDLEQHGRIGPARALLRRALAAATEPADRAFCHYQLGDLAWDAGQLAEADRQYRAGIAADPAYLPPYQGWAMVAAARGDLPAALSGYAALTARSPTPDYLLEYAELLRAAGRTDDAAEQVALADAAHRLFLASRGTDDLTGAEIALARGEPAEALKLARQEWQRRQFAEVADLLAWTLHLTGDHPAALELAGRAGAVGARSARFAYHLGMIHLSLGDDAAARRELSRALDLNPSFSPVDAPVAAGTLAELESR